MKHKLPRENRALTTDCNGQRNYLKPTRSRLPPSTALLQPHPRPSQAVRGTIPVCLVHSTTLLWKSPFTVLTRLLTSSFFKVKAQCQRDRSGNGTPALLASLSRLHSGTVPCSAVTFHFPVKKDTHTSIFQQRGVSRRIRP